MSTTTRLEQSIQTACEHGAMCVHDRSGHGLTGIRLRLALATRSGWRDAVVESVDADGWIDLRLVADGDLVRVWNHADLSEVLALGEPVALHERYEVLAAGSLHLNIAV
ncbi:hypothetical protein [Microbacterium gorillae]|uniref:hypothetical protein n=1 Tax=Microbacterium gorillae TaxID=1231063 RepID=UPI003D984737